jgi:hypothetical protein
MFFAIKRLISLDKFLSGQMRGALRASRNCRPAAEFAG